MGFVILFWCIFLFSALLFVCETRSPASLGLIGDPIDVTRTTSGGTALVGGGRDVDAAMIWMINKSGGGDFVVIRVTGTDAYNSYIYELGPVDSVETLRINSRTLANDPQVEATIRGAEAVFIAGGDQANYVNYWKDTKVEDALNYLRNVKQVPIGGTSAGCAILGGTYFSALQGTVTSREALDNPYNKYLTLGHNDFLDQPYLSNVITDTHFNNPDRRGRLVTFLARMNQDYGIVGRGIGIDESTAVCIESDGIGRVFGSGTAFFLSQNGLANGPEVCARGSPLDWHRHREAVIVYKILGSRDGSESFDLSTWSPGSGDVDQYYYVDRGTLEIFYGDKK
jgi:cyanophycinase